jgi:hypothetical protein
MKMWMIFVLFWSSFSLAKTQTIEGRLLERGTQVPLKNVQVFILPHRLETETDTKGNFKFESVPEGVFTLLVNAPGYQRFERPDNTDFRERRNLFIERQVYAELESVTVGQVEKRDKAVKTLTQDQFLTVPGAGGDPVKAVQNLPGVNRVQGFSSRVVIQGSDPGDTRYDIDGHEIPQAFHFGGLTSVVMPESIERVDYLSAGYGPENGRAMGGIVSLKTREPEAEDRDKKYFFFADTLKAGGLYEQKIDDKSRFLISGRYSYVGQILSRVFEDNEQLNLTVVPEFADLTGIYTRDLGDGEKVKVLFLASRDSLGFLFKEPLRADPSIRGEFKNEIQFYRLIPQWQKKISESSEMNFSVGIGQNRFLAEIAENYFRNRNWQMTVRGEWQKTFSENLTSQFGFDNQYSRGAVEVRLPSFQNAGGVNDPFSSGELQEVTSDYRIANLGLYNRNEIKRGQTTYVPSLRFERYTLTEENFVLPRFAVNHQHSDSLLLKAATGLYVQPPNPQETDKNFGNPDIRSPQALHFMTGFEKDFRGGAPEGYLLSSSLFYRDFQGLVVRSPDIVTRDGQQVPEIYDNEGTGLAYGAEFLLKFRNQDWDSWISYTWSLSRRTDPRNGETPSEFDQTHNFNLVAARELPRNWKLSGRFRYVTGNPITPVVGAYFDADNDVYLPERGPIYSERLGDFFQLDLRADKKWIYDTSIWSFYIDIQNIFNTQNAEDFQYSYDFSNKQKVTGLPLFPSIGVKGEF